MPARTLPSPDPALSPPRFQTRPSPTAHPSSHPHRDVNDNRLEPSPYAPAMPSNARPDPDYSSQSGWSPPQPRVYPDPASIPPHWQVHPATLTQLRPGEGRAYVPPNPALQASARLPWQNPYTRPMQFQPVVAPPPPPIPHKVWILDCKGCGTFLTNRGMKAVLLLRPNVPLYSTDALPINCSAFSPELDTPSHTPSASVSSTASAGPSHSAHPSLSGPSSDAAQPGGSSDRPPTRTCECLTQTLCCHGCGNAVGYMIVTPCQRCTSSITVNNRATNGHRFVFYSSEITACERHYVLGERGVSRFHPPAPPTSLVQAVQAGLSGLTITTPPRPFMAQQPSPSSPSTPTSMPPLSPGPAFPGRRTSIDYLPTPPPEVDNPFALPSRPSPGTTATISRSPRASITTSSPSAPNLTQTRSGPLEEARQAVPPVPPNSHSTSPHTATNPTRPVAALAHLHTSPASLSPSRARAASTSAALSPSTSAPSAPALHVHLLNGSPVFLRGPLYSLQPVQPVPPPPPEPIKSGEVLFWHHLTRSGEIPAVAEDPRARVGKLGADEKESGRRNTIPSGVVAGR
ncbi:hypothetical protein C8Q80DRAFT_833587 [Daedaleopsis nitida]|nr:hypothetical protein C8Q80DRAFT_833587 [Daedaleopsis nitida]